ncbi:MAG: SDR family NAD(P)-dependent oxidoreductase [Planctomycetaceae bacterium]|nr:SDR family NAD(P)-dependent oxidoreductase [Planctomycetaceae bacterium]
MPSYHAYQAASLAARILGLTGPRTVIDAACASSLVALAQAMLAIRAGRIDSAVVGGATYNNIDNLILFSHSQACTATDSRPFDDHASGLVSSEGYVAVVIMTQELAVRHDLPILGVIRGVGIASDGKGRSLWAPRMEGQVLALQRAYADDAPLDIDYIEAHATSTQLGDATELETLRRLAGQQGTRKGSRQLLIGSVKSNIGHTLEAAGLIGLVKVLIAMQRREIPPSLRYEQPNRNYDWEAGPVRVVSGRETWPEHALHLRPRRAAVSAFGIGGLNAHVVVEEPGAGIAGPVAENLSAPLAPRPSLRNEPIAIVGRGIIVAGAKNLDEFRSLLESDRSALTDAPESRWRRRAGVSNSETSVTHHTPHCHGGFVTDFTFNGSRYAIPPKQVQQANPVQLMLIDAVSQALTDLNSTGTGRAADVSRPMSRVTGKHPGTDVPCSPENVPFDRQRIGVVVGTIFGGEFGDQLQVGMRLPEICQSMADAMQHRGVPDQLARQITTEFRQIVLKNRPALLDETGSFTASTLSSRIAKTFDLMGGACSLDSDDTSGLSAISVAADQLRSGTCDMIVCGSAQRSMSLSAFEALDMNGRLLRSGRPEDMPDDCRQILPGEGVVALMLCRLSDAKRLNLPIHGILGDVVQDVPDSDALNAADAAIVRRIGYLAGAHSLVRITAETLTSDRSVRGVRNDNRLFRPHEKIHPEADSDDVPGEVSASISIAARTADGIELRVPLSIPVSKSSGGHVADAPPVARRAVRTIPAADTSGSSSPLSTQVTSQMSIAKTATDSPLRSVRFAAESGSSLLQLLKHAISSIELSEADQRILRATGRQNSASPEFTGDDQYRAIVLADSTSQLRQRLNAAVKAAEAGRFRCVLDRDRVILWQIPRNAPRVAWLFPGQGAHYHETPSVLSASSVARKTIAAVDQLYAADNLPPLSVAFENAAIKPGGDVWWAQAWVLGVSAALIETLKAEGLQPDAVLGHSFGEFTASLAANVTTLPQAVELAKHRANAVVSHMRVPGGLLSIRAAVHEVDAILKTAGLAVYVTHLNSTKQTVIAGSREGIDAAKKLLDTHSLASMAVSVPAPFHTPLLSDAETAFERMSATVSMRPPVCGFLSATCVQYLAEPSSIRTSLVRQLTQPVMYMPSIQRMLGEGYSVFLEVGPNDVLTRMNRDIVGDQTLCLSLDVPGQPFAERLQLVHAALECVGRDYRPRHQHDTFASMASMPIGGRQLDTSQPNAPAAFETDTVFDVTRSRRTARKAVLSDDSVSAGSASDSSEHHNVGQATMYPLSSSHTNVTSQPQKSRSVSSALSDAQLKHQVLDLVIELTGYAPDVVDFDADLEAHLGIDSIKKAQILGEIGVWLGLTVRPDGLRFDSVRTLDDAIQTVRKLAEVESDIEHASLPAATLSPTSATSSAPSAALRSTMHRGSLPPNEQLDALLIDYVVDQTGYAPEIVDLDADLEADLGLDSIKLAQLIGEMREQFSLESLTLESMGQNRFRTLREIREFLVQHAASGLASAPRYTDVTETRDYSAPSISGSSLTSPSPNGTALLAGNMADVHKNNLNTSIRGTEPIREITPEWSQWFYSQNGQPVSVDTAMQIGLQHGQQHRSKIRSALRSLVSQQAESSSDQNWNEFESARFAGVAAGAGVAESSVRFAVAVVRDRTQPVPEESVNISGTSSGGNILDAVVAKPATSQVTQRFALRVIPAPRRSGMPMNPELHGAALILGHNPLAEKLADRIRHLGQKAFVVNTSVPVRQLEKSLTEFWDHTPTPHVFLTMAFDADAARNLSEADWKHRRPAALEAPFRICQLWMQRTIDADRMEHASVIAVTQLGGDFGFSGQQVQSVEAIGGLVKAMLIEAWMRGFRTTPMKVIDMASSMTPEESACGILQELAVPSYDMEIAFRSARSQPERPQFLNTDRKIHEFTTHVSPERLCVQAVAAPLNPAIARSPEQTKPRMSRGSTWIVSGGGRGITAVIAMTLAAKYDLKLHLLGTAPVPNLNDEFVRRVAADRSGVRNQIMQDATARGESPVEAWRNVEKAIEIDRTLRDCRQQGITATYHSCDVSDFADVKNVVDTIRQQAGPICGVIHGAGAGQDARFDRKRPDKVEKCLCAKIDGSLALMQATQADPLEWFVAFGSISGRFGANGHTDYSLANDMMAKIVDRYRSQRPEVRSVTFHWHAWGDIGMATKPEAKLALEMIDMEFMPARDGIAHFMRELEFGGDEPEVLITDDNYFRKFYPADRLSIAAEAVDVQTLPLLPSTVSQHDGGICSSVVTLNPVSDRFLSQHRVQNRPTLPFVVALELMAEAVRARTGKFDVGRCGFARATQAIRFASEDPLAVTLQSRVTNDGGIECRLLADVRRRDGRMVEEDREYFRAVFGLCDPQVVCPDKFLPFEVPDTIVSWQRIKYGPADGMIYHGPELQELREVADDGHTIFGRIAASAPVQLFGAARAHGFTVPCATMDACLYAIGYAAWQRYQKPSLPVRFGQIDFGRIPDPGEPCLVRIQQKQLLESGAQWDFQLQGHNGDRLLTVSNYEIGWLKG